MATVLLVRPSSSADPVDHAVVAACRRALPHVRLLTADGDGARSVHPPRRGGSALGRLVRSVDCVVIAGGTVFAGEDGTSAGSQNPLRRVAAVVARARLHGARVALLGVGATELHGRAARAMAQWIVSASDLVVLRDEESASVLAAAGLPTPFRIGADLSWVDVEARPSDRSPGEHLTVALGASRHPRELVSLLTAGLAPFVGCRPIRVQPWPSGPNGDVHRLAVALREGLGGDTEIEQAVTSTADTCNRRAHDRLVISTSLHALICAGAAGTPFVAIVDRPELGGVARRLGQVAVPTQTSAGVLTHAVAVGLEQRPPPRSAVRGEMARAEEAFALLRLLVDEGQLHDPVDISCLSGLPLSNGAGIW